MRDYQMIAKTFKGLEGVLAQELIELGADNVQQERRAVSFTGDLRLMYRANLCLRTASRILKPITSFTARDADEVYHKMKEINWEQYMSLTSTFAIDTTVYSESFRHSKYVTYRAKDAIADWFMERYDKRPNVRIEGAEMLLNIHIAQEKVTICLDSTGESLHKRGWRTAMTEAPINACLAAGMILMTGWRGESDFYDPMCGSGTLLIEAAMIAQNIAPGICRQSFAFEKWRDFDRDLFEELYNDDSAERDFEHHIYGSDSSFYAVRAAEQNIKNAGVQRLVSVRQIRMQELPEFNKGSLIVMNPPYGERIEPRDIYKLYGEIGTVLKHKAADCNAWIISSNEEALKNIGLHPSKKIPLLNGELECLYNHYELFSGERKNFVAARQQQYSAKKPSHNYKHQSDSKDDSKSKSHSASHRRFQLSSSRREDRQVPAQGKRPFKTPSVQRRRDKRE